MDVEFWAYTGQFPSWKIFSTEEYFLYGKITLSLRIKSSFGERGVWRVCPTKIISGFLETQKHHMATNHLVSFISCINKISKIRRAREGNIIYLLLNQQLLPLYLPKTLPHDRSASYPHSSASFLSLSYSKLKVPGSFNHPLLTLFQSFSTLITLLRVRSLVNIPEDVIPRTKC